MTSLTRIAWPGFKVRSRTIPLRLLRSPSTATRSAIGVTPGWSAEARGTSMLMISLPASSDLLHAADSASGSSRSKARKCITLIRASTPRNRRCLPDGYPLTPTIPLDGRRPSSR